MTEEISKVEILPEENFKNNDKEKKKKRKVIELGVLLLIILGALFYGYTIISSPKNIILKNLKEKGNGVYQIVTDLNNNSELFMKKKTRKYKETSETKFSLSGDLEDTEFNDVKNTLDKIKLKTVIMSDISKNHESVDLDVIYDEASAINFGMINTNGKIYLDLKKHFNKLIQLEQAETSNEMITIEEIKKIDSKLSEILIKNLSVGTFSTLNKDGMKKSIYTLKENEIKDYFVNSFTDMKNEKEIFELVTNRFKGVSKADYEEFWNELIDEVKYEDYKGLKLSYAVYTKGLLNDLVKSELTLDYEEERTKITFEDNQITIIDSETDFDIVLKKVDINNGYKYMIEADEIVVSLSIINDEKEIKKDKEYSFKRSFSVAANTPEGNFEIKIESTGVTVFDEVLEIKNIDNAVGLKNLTEEDYMAIYESFILDFSDHPLFEEFVKYQENQERESIDTFIGVLNNKIKEAKIDGKDIPVIAEPEWFGHLPTYGVTGYRVMIKNDVIVEGIFLYGENQYYFDGDTLEIYTPEESSY